ncbi:MAG TPA: metalloregulator ArsR/SmtB family transcription factor, partial [Thermomicrobiales bacterium]|nr:metalloregulator ArsR/SmtB family transcription factor [Thermomicrobiales bacterium]
MDTGGRASIPVIAGEACPPGGPLAPPLAPAAAADHARAFRALGDETRLQIVRLLAQQPEPLCVCWIESAFGLTQSGVSYHLRVLREAGLVTTQRRGTWIYYRLDLARLG